MFRTIAKEGYAVFPVRDKQPLVKWRDESTTDPKQLERWDKLYPGASVGIDCGKSGIVVIDQDVKQGIDGIANWEALNGPATAANVNTPSGGRHSYYADPDHEWTNSAGALAPGVDVRAVGGYVVAYGPVPALDSLPVLPVALRPVQARREPVSADTLSAPYALASFSRGLADLLAAPEGERNAELNRVSHSAGKFIPTYLAESMVRDALEDAAARIGLEPRETRLTIDSGLRAGMALVEPEPRPDRLLTGRDFLYGPEAYMPMLWVPDDAAMWAEGESLMFFGPPGSGKSTLAQDLVVARTGGHKEVFGSQVTDSGGAVLYLAMDRPAQVIRSMRRMFKESDAELDRLIAWRGPLKKSITIEENRDVLADFAQKEGATTVVIDSLKDVLPNASDETAAGNYNSARQELLARDIQLIEIHHNRKGHGDNRMPNKLDDVYGSRQITAGAGSVLCLWTKDTESADIELFHVKTLIDPYRRRIVTLDKAAGTFDMGSNTVDITSVLMLAPKGMGPAEVTKELYGASASTADKERVKKQLQRLAAKGEIRKMEGGIYRA